MAAPLLMPLAALGISQLYISQKKLEGVRKWYGARHICPDFSLPVFDFGTGRYTLTDGHTRAYAAFLLGAKSLWVHVDTDDIVTNQQGMMLYRTCIGWCEAEGLLSIDDLDGRVVSDTDYKALWVDRCARMHAEIIPPADDGSPRIEML